MTIPSIGMIGVGRFGNNHSRILSELSECNYLGLFDINAIRAAEIAQRDSVKQFSDLKELLNACRGVVIAASTEAHYTIAKEALTSGVSVMVEKPVCINENEAEELIQLADSEDLILAVGHLERFNAALKKGIALIADPDVIQVERHGIWTDRIVTADVILDLMIHDLDILPQIGISNIHSVSAFARNVVNGCYDECQASFRTDTGAMVTFSASRTSHHRHRELRMYNFDDGVIVDLINQNILKQADDGSYAALKTNKSEPLREELIEFCNAVSGKPATTIARGLDGMLAVRNANLIKSALKR
jgi:predicted dehydrogenase